MINSLVPLTLNTVTSSGGAVNINDLGGGITVAGQVNTSGFATVDLSASGPVTAPDTPIVAGVLDVTSVGGSNLMSGSNQFGTLSVTNTSGGRVDVADSVACTLDHLSTTGTAALTISGPLTSVGTISAGALNLSASAFTNENTVTANTINLSGNTMSLAAGSLTTSGTGNSVALTPLTNGTSIDLAGTASGFDLSSADLNSITTSALTIGDPTSGAITLSGAVAPANASSIALSSAAGISGGSISDATVALDTTASSAVTIAPGSVQFGSGQAVDDTGVSTLDVSAPGQLAVTPSASTAYSLTGGGSGVLDDFTDGNTVSGTPIAPSGTIDAPQVLPVSYSGMASVDLVPSAATSTITPTIASIPADGTSTTTITVQAKDASGTDYTSGGNTVTLHTTEGTLSAVTDDGNGTYTATLTSRRAGTADISAMLDGLTIASGDASVASSALPTSGGTATATTTPPPTTPVAAPPADPGPVAVRVADVSTTGDTMVWCAGSGCGYPDAALQFTLTRATTVRLVLRARDARCWRAVATSRLVAHAGANRDRIAGRWHGQLIPARPVQILVQLRFGGRWRTERTLTLVVRHSH